MRFFIFTLCYSYSLIHAQITKFDWIISEGYNSSIGNIQLTTDLFSNTIVAFRYIISPIEQCGKKYISNTENTDIEFLVKYNSKGQCIWQHKFTDNFTGVLDAGLFLSTDLLGNILIAGAHRGKVWLDSEHFIQSPDGVGEAFVAKLDPNGKLLWHRILKNEKGKLGEVSVGRVTTDQEGNIYLSSVHSYGHLILDSIRIEYQSLVGSHKATVFKLDPNGKMEWYKKMESYSNIFQHIKINNNQQIILAGSFTGTELSVDQVILRNRDTVNPKISSDAVLLVLDQTGNVKFIKSLGGNKPEYVSDMTIDEQGNIFIGGTSESKEIDIFSKKIFSLPSSQYSINFLAKINPNYELEWLFDDHVLGWFSLHFIVLNKNKDLWTAWRLSNDTIILNGIPFVSMSDSSPDFLFIRFKNSGNIDQVFQLNGNGWEGTGCVDCTGLHPDGGIVISGLFSSDTLFFGDIAIPKVSRQKIGDRTSTGFIARMSPDGMVGSKDVSKQESNLISIHPNPARDLIQIQFDEELHADGHIEILTTTGTLMMFLHINKGSTSTNVDVRNWPAGVYFVRYRDMEGRSSVERVVVE
ncbi:MAG: T9SS type A sorting domain-containing protein [Saprospiraceae bacterium]|nr:T9SS type A sorting domain-containing protein [Candidatus Vicinibacter proximus]